MSVLGRSLMPNLNEFKPITRHSDCYLCAKPILDGQERVDGITISAHRECLHAKLDKLNSNWRREGGRPTITGTEKAKSDAADNPGTRRTLARHGEAMRFLEAQGYKL